VLYEDEACYACLAFHPKSTGHTVVAWKSHVKDLDDLSQDDYHHLFEIIRRVRTALARVYPGVLVYVDYWNETGHVHVHLIPRHRGSTYMGSELVTQQSGNLTDFSKVPVLAEMLR
jgi:diadenosine tetraphosphate (Ap4A) HIT family hydrolase